MPEIYEPCEKAAEALPDEGEWGHHNCAGTGRPEEGIEDCACTCHLGTVDTSKSTDSALTTEHHDHQYPDHALLRCGLDARHSRHCWQKPAGGWFVCWGQIKTEAE